METLTVDAGFDGLAPSFADFLQASAVCLERQSIDTVQINVGKLCNQSCTHCHVMAGPQRREIMDQRNAELAMELVEAAQAKTVDLTGGAPELNPAFRYLVRQSVSQRRHVIDRCNLTVLLEPGCEDLPTFLAEQSVEIVASMPCYTQGNVDAQRGSGVYDRSVEALRKLNRLGYGLDGSGLVLNLVYNPGGPFLPGPQTALEADYRRELMDRHGIQFNRLLTIANAPIGRFGLALAREGELAGYQATLVSAANPAALSHLMCRQMISISWDGFICDCDFNQALDLRLGDDAPFRLGQIPAADLVRRLVGREIVTGSHCYSCSAGSGSSCRGALV